MIEKEPKDFTVVFSGCMASKFEEWIKEETLKLEKIDTDNYVVSGIDEVASKKKRMDLMRFATLKAEIKVMENKEEKEKKFKELHKLGVDLGLYPADRKGKLC